MAKKETAPKNVLERVYNVPLRREYLKAPNWRRTPKAVRALRQFISKHMKSEDILIGKYANLELWKHGIKNPPHHIKVNAVKNDKGVVKVELVDLSGKAKRELEKVKVADKKKEDIEKQKEAEEKAKKDAEKKKSEEAKAAEDSKKQEEKAKQKEEIKDLKKELPKQPPKQAPQPKQVQRQPTAPKSQ
jgi:large subunit ribosomal protein L31e|tara:strand:- start:75 stop:638 length:564 start_codon:yes stop_codon:yes gene_type:complete